jgi:hypothetical protein
MFRVPRKWQTVSAMAGAESTRVTQLRIESGSLYFVPGLRDATASFKMNGHAWWKLYAKRFGDLAFSWIPTKSSQPASGRTLTESSTKPESPTRGTGSITAFRLNMRPKNLMIRMTF